MKKQLLALFFALLSTNCHASSWFLDANNRNVGDITMSNGRPVTSSGIPFTEVTGKPGHTSNTVTFANGNTGSINLQGMDFRIVGNVSIGGNATVRNFIIG